MISLKVNNKEYKIKFGYNSFCDTDLLDRTSDLVKTLQGSGAVDDKDVAFIGRIKELFCCVRDLLFVGFQKYNPVENVQEIGEILDDYHDGATEDDKRGILDLFTKLTGELMDEGFLGDLIQSLQEEAAEEPKLPKVPQDHKKPQK